MSVVNQQGEGGGRTLHLQHHEGQGHGLHLARQLHTQHQAGLYRDTVLHCQNGTISVNRLLIGLMYKQVASTDIFSLPDKVDLILPDNTTEEVGDDLAKLLCVDIENNDETELNDTDEDNSKNDSFDGQYGSDLVKTEITECSPDINVKLEVKKEYEGVHVGDSDPTYKWSCYICKETFRRAEQLTSHALELHNTDRPYHCSYCKFTTKEKGQLQRHENTHTRASQVSCDVCGKSFLDMRDLNNHKTVHSDVRNMACEHCDKSFKSDLYLKRHIKLMHTSNPGEFKCEICDKLFKTKEYLSRHEKKIHGDPIYYVCSFCGKNFKSASHRKDHEEIHRGEADAECGLCGAQVRKKNLERHMKTHSDDAEFQCDICAKPLKTVEALRAHMNSHDLPFKCEYCEKAFSTKYSMKSHTVQQHLLKRESDNSKSKIDKPMTKCDQCDYQCATSKYMKTHKAVKHEGFFHKCQDCKFTTGDLGSLRSHRRAKHEGVVYSCDQCEFKSGYKNNLKNHKAVAHFSVDGRNVFLNPQPDLPKPPQDGLDEQGEDCSKIPKTSWMERP
eukprot:GFUD01026410.1.p1 GENE.GFUD01026410.1~~GFUD01026410.1.p1  ORF type:complete len:558 (+),score=107.32 GFUD01026410.1:36-1709(+)